MQAERHVRAREGLVHAVSRERIDEARGVADRERAAARHLGGRAAHGQAVPADLRERRPGDVVALADAAQVIPQVRALGVPAAHADVRVVALREQPAVAAGDVAQLQQGDVLLHARPDVAVGDVASSAGAKIRPAQSFSARPQMPFAPSLRSAPRRRP